MKNHSKAPHCGRQQGSRIRTIAFISLSGALLLCVFQVGVSVGKTRSLSPEQATTQSSSKSLKTASSLSQILQESNSDKFWRHHYEKYYEKWLEPFRKQRGIKMCEIGAKDGESLTAWGRYFESPELILGLAYGQGIANLEQTVSDFNHIRIIHGDQSKIETLARLCELGPFDIVIDDGSHVPQHQIISFFHLWKECVKPGGLFVVEDLETNYWNGKRKNLYGYQLNGTGIGVSPNESAVEKFKQLIDILTRYQLGEPAMMSIVPGDDEICSITFGMNIMAFHKCTEKEQQDRPRDAPFGKVVNPEHMKEYIEKAKSTNPEYVDLRTLFKKKKETM